MDPRYKDLKIATAQVVAIVVFTARAARACSTWARVLARMRSRTFKRCSGGVDAINESFRVLAFQSKTGALERWRLQCNDASTSATS